jgi:hypothetical protein
MQENKDTEFYPVVLVICRSPIIHVEVDFNLLGELDGDNHPSRLGGGNLQE